MVYFSLVCLLKLILYKSKAQNQMCDRNQKCFWFVLQKSYIKLFYMTHTFDSEVSLHSWLVWPTVCRAIYLLSHEAYYVSTFVIYRLDWCILQKSNWPSEPFFSAQNVEYRVNTKVWGSLPLLSLFHRRPGGTFSKLVRIKFHSSIREYCQEGNLSNWFSTSQMSGEGFSRLKSFR